VRWWSAIFGIFLLAWAVGFAFGLRKPWEISTTDAAGNETTEYRRLRPREQLLLAAGILVAGVFGGLLLAGAIPWIDERVPEERLLLFLGVCLATVAFAAGAAVVWIQVWRSRKMGDDDRGRPGAELYPEAGPEEAVVGTVVALLLSHPVGAMLLGAVCAAGAVFSATQLVAAWRGDGDQLDAAMQWLQPVSALGDLLGLSEVTVALILLGIWLVIAVARENAGAALTVFLTGVYAFVALAWPLGLLDEWLGLGRDTAWDPRLVEAVRRGASS
jgi:hypothetical protein